MFSKDKNFGNPSVWSGKVQFKRLSQRLKCLKDSVRYRLRRLDEGFARFEANICSFQGSYVIGTVE
jgi:hypothetical protein